MRTRFVLLIAASLAFSLPVAPARSVSAPVCDDAWHYESGPQDGQILRAVSSRWIQGAWAVGLVHDSTLGVDRTYLEHWNGDVWRHALSPNMTDRSMPTDNALYAVTGIGHDVWAAGSYTTTSARSSDVYHPLAMHYDGHAWSIVPT
ncbi:MAG: hypothetical protein QOG88_1470, partial [Actinomycetota bacterium]|nr:hypothetical protein [Actinomycetota bacterium]